MMLLKEKETFTNCMECGEILPGTGSTARVSILIFAWMDLSLLIHFGETTTTHQLQDLL